MTPAQAALHWNIKRHVAVIPGVDVLEHITENCATLSKLKAAPVVVPPPPRPLQKIVTVWKQNRDIMYDTGTPADPGTFVTRDDGKIYSASDEARLAAKDKSKDTDRLVLTDEQDVLLGDVGGAVAQLG